MKGLLFQSLPGRKKKRPFRVRNSLLSSGSTELIDVDFSVKVAYFLHLKNGGPFFLLWKEMCDLAENAGCFKEQEFINQVIRFVCL